MHRDRSERGHWHCARFKRSHVAVVPVRETEAWLLLEEVAIRTVAGHPKGKAKLLLPKPDAVERIANPKERLQQALVKACGLQDRRLERFRTDFPIHRQLLMRQLSFCELLKRVPSWQRMRSDIRAAVSRLP